MVVDTKQHKSQFNNSNITITQSQKNSADCVKVKFEFEQFFLHIQFMHPIQDRLHYIQDHPHNSACLSEFCS